MVAPPNYPGFSVVAHIEVHQQNNKVLLHDGALVSLFWVKCCSYNIAVPSRVTSGYCSDNTAPRVRGMHNPLCDNNIGILGEVLRQML